MIQRRIGGVDGKNDEPDQCRHGVAAKHFGGLNLCVS